MEITDQIFRNALNGDMQAFELIVTSYERLVYSVALRFLKNPEDAKDASQEVFIKVYRNLDKCKDISVLKSWICAITNNTCIDIIRKQKRQSTLSLDEQIATEDSSFAFEIQSDEKTPEQQYIEEEDYESLKKAIENLPVDYRSVIVLRDIHNLSYSEVAEAASINIGTVKSRLARGRAMLRKMYAG